MHRVYFPTTYLLSRLNSEYAFQETVEGLNNGTYHFALPRTQGQPPEDFVKYVSFRDSSGALSSAINDLGEWEVAVNGLPVFIYVSH